MQKLILLVGILLTTGMLLGQSTVNLDSGLVAYYPFDGNANDFSGHGNHGTVHGATLTSDAQGNPDNAYYFDGENDYIMVEDSPRLEPSSFSVSFWTKLNTLQTKQYQVFVFKTDGYHSGFKVIFQSETDFSHPGFRRVVGIVSGPEDDNEGRKFIYANTMIDNTTNWYHIVLTYQEGQKTRLYINGELDQEVQGPVSWDKKNSGRLVFGKVYDESPSPFYEGYLNGALDQVRYYNRVLTEQEIKNLYLNYGGKADIQLTVDSLYALQGDTVMVPVNVVLPKDSVFSSAELELAGYLDRLELLDIIMDSSLSGDANWNYQSNERDSLITIWLAGADEISGEGVLFWLKFAVPENSTGFVPIDIISASFDTGTLSALSRSGGVKIFPYLYGDTDLNDQIQAYDASLILKHLVGKVDLDTFQIANANVSMDTTLSALDATLILQYGVGIIEELPFDISDKLLKSSGTIMMTNQYILPAQQIVVPLTLRDRTDIYAVEGRIHYNPDDLILKDILWVDYMQSTTIETHVNEAEIQFACAGEIPDGETGTFVRLLFEVSPTFNSDSTVVALEELRLNESPAEHQVAQSVLYYVTAVENKNASNPAEFKLYQNFPNPFNPKTTITYSLPQRSDVVIQIYNLEGKLVDLFSQKSQDSGKHSLVWDASQLGSGVYFCKIQAGSFVSMVKMLYLK